MIAATAATLATLHMKATEALIVIPFDISFANPGRTRRQWRVRREQGKMLEAEMFLMLVAAAEKEEKNTAKGSRREQEESTKTWLI